MAHESFEDEQVAALLNESFVSIKVDREERPDIDAAYMAACQAVTGSGGWPLTAVLDHDQRPWFVGTYFPKETRGKMGMVELLPALADAWKTKREEVLANANHIVSHAQRGTTAPGEPDAAWFEEAETELLGRFDAENGGFGRAPKFPSPHQLRFLLRRHLATGSPGALQAVEKTLTAMLCGGIHDHVGGGFHRYSTDSQWRLPHFEKMLYDQAMLMRAFTEAWQVTGNPAFQAAVYDIAAYVQRDLQHPEGGFYSAEDADSDGEEGTFYIWRHDELQALLPDASAFCADFQVQREGNFRDEASGQPHPANILHATSTAALADHASALEALRAARNQRTRPLLDDKILADWNGLMVGSLARAGAAFNDDALLDAAKHAAGFVQNHMMVDGSLRHRWHDGRLDAHAFLDDYAFVAAGLLDLFEATGDVHWLQQARGLCATMQQDFQTKEGAFALRSKDAPAQVIERVDAYDGAIPSGNSVALDVLDRLGRLTGEPELADATWE